MHMQCHILFLCSVQRLTFLIFTCARYLPFFPYIPLATIPIKKLVLEHKQSRVYYSTTRTYSELLIINYCSKNEIIISQKEEITISNCVQKIFKIFVKKHDTLSFYENKCRFYNRPNFLLVKVY